jgi:hypothetical protein
MMMDIILKGMITVVYSIAVVVTIVSSREAVSWFNGVLEAIGVFAVMYVVLWPLRVIWEEDDDEC